MSQQEIKERNEPKQTTTEIKHYLREQYKQSSKKKVEIHPPRLSRNTRLYRSINSKT